MEIGVTFLRFHRHVYALQKCKVFVQIQILEKGYPTHTDS